MYFAKNLKIIARRPKVGIFDPVFGEQQQQQANTKVTAVMLSVASCTQVQVSQKFSTRANGFVHSSRPLY